jgi:hypothetical protein
MTCTIVTVERQLGAALKVKAPLAKLPEAHRATRAKINREVCFSPEHTVLLEGQASVLWAHLPNGLGVRRQFVRVGHQPSARCARGVAETLIVSRVR